MDCEIVSRVTAREAQAIVDLPGVIETFFGGQNSSLPDDPSVYYIQIPSGIVILSPLNSNTHIVHVAMRPGERKYSGLMVKAALEWFRRNGGRQVIAMIPAVHRAAIGLAWNTGFRLCGRIQNGCEHGELLIFEDDSWVQ